MEKLQEQQSRQDAKTKEAIDALIRASAALEFQGSLNLVIGVESNAHHLAEFVQRVAIDESIMSKFDYSEVGSTSLLTWNPKNAISDKIYFANMKEMEIPISPGSTTTETRTVIDESTEIFKLNKQVSQTPNGTQLDGISISTIKKSQFVKPLTHDTEAERGLYDAAKFASDNFKNQKVLVSGTNNVEVLSQSQLDTLIPFAKDYWKSTGANEDKLNSINIVVSSILPKDSAAITDVNTNYVRISETGAGYGWYVDSTPMQNEEFVSTLHQSTFCKPLKIPA